MIQVRINELLKENNKSKYWLETQMGGYYKSLNKLINNETTSIHFKTLDKLCTLFDCKVSDIIVFEKTCEFEDLL